MIRLMTIAALGLATACAAQTSTQVLIEKQPSVAPVSVAEAAQAKSKAHLPSDVVCDIRTSQTAKGQRLEAIAQANRKLQGTYQFQLSALGLGGSSDVTQGGEFDLAAGESAMVGMVEIPRGRYRAELTLSDAGGDLCRLERRS